MVCNQDATWPGEDCYFVISLQINQVKDLQFILSVEIVFASFSL